MYTPVSLTNYTPLQRTDITLREKWLFKTCEHLIACLPQFRQWITNPANIGTLDIVVKQVNLRWVCGGMQLADCSPKLSEGADSARGDDAALLKTRVVSWLTEKETPEPCLSPSNKAGRGFHNDSTAHLICPVDYDWDKSE